jgi:hypothetical protein
VDQQKIDKQSLQNEKTLRIIVGLLTMTASAAAFSYNSKD